jgi:hypothetical protein
MKYTKEQRRTAHCEICGVSMGEQSKLAQWQKRICFECQQEVNDICFPENLDYATGVQIAKDRQHQRDQNSISSGQV